MTFALSRDECIAERDSCLEIANASVPNATRSVNEWRKFVAESEARLAADRACLRRAEKMLAEAPEAAERMRRTAEFWQTEIDRIDAWRTNDGKTRSVRALSCAELSQGSPSDEERFA